MVARVRRSSSSMLPEQSTDVHEELAAGADAEKSRFPPGGDLVPVVVWGVAIVGSAAWGLEEVAAPLFHFVLGEDTDFVVAVRFRCFGGCCGGFFLGFGGFFGGIWVFRRWWWLAWLGLLRTLSLLRYLPTLSTSSNLPTLECPAPGDSASWLLALNKKRDGDRCHDHENSDRRHA